MRSKDLIVGMEVALKVRSNVYRAWVLQKDTTWVELRGYSFRDSTRPDTSKVAVAYEAKWAKYLQMDVVQNAAILSPWSDYLVQKEKEDAATAAKWQADKDRYAKQAAERAEHCASVQQLADQLGVALQASESGKVIIALADLQRITATPPPRGRGPAQP